MHYDDFASKVSFYEFTQDEFQEPHFKTSQYREELKCLENGVNVERLTEVFRTHPRAIDVLEELVQLRRFTNAQYTNFCFDVHLLNNASESLLVRYIEKGIFKFESGKANPHFAEIFRRISGGGVPKDRTKLVADTKRAIVKYVAAIEKSRHILHTHLFNSVDARVRTARYLIENLNADDHLACVNLKEFLRFKKYPRDTKGLHGDFGIRKIADIIEKSGFRDCDSEVSSKVIPLTGLLPASHMHDFCYLRERSIEHVKKRKSRTTKVFDFVLLYDGEPKVAIETNFYTTSGTKIGINEGEYTDLLDDIEDVNRGHRTKLLFIWVTDGNYWLTTDGEKRFENLKRNYFKRKHELLNYNLLKENLPTIMEEMKR